MRTEHLKQIKYLGIIFLSVILSYKLPHNSFSIINYLIGPIKRQNSVLYPSSFVILILFIVGIIGILKLEIYKKRNKLLITLLILFVIIPFMTWTINAARTGYYIINPGISSIDIEKSNIVLNQSNSEATIGIHLKLKDYGRHLNKFKIRVYLPKTLSNDLNKEYLELKTLYQTYGHNVTLTIDEDIPVDPVNDNFYSLSNSDWSYENVRYELYNDKESITILDHGY